MTRARGMTRHAPRRVFRDRREAGRVRAAEFSWSTYTADVVALYRQVHPEAVA